MRQVEGWRGGGECVWVEWVVEGVGVEVGVPPPPSHLGFIDNVAGQWARTKGYGGKEVGGSVGGKREGSGWVVGGRARRSERRGKGLRRGSKEGGSGEEGWGEGREGERVAVGGRGRWEVGGGG